MHLETEIKKALREIPVPYEIVKKTDHYFLAVTGQPRICIGNNHGKSKPTTVRATLVEIRKLIERVSND